MKIVSFFVLSQQNASRVGQNELTCFSFILRCGCVFLLPERSRMAPMRYQIRECSCELTSLQRTPRKDVC